MLYKQTLQGKIILSGSFVESSWDRREKIREGAEVREVCAAN